MVRAAVLTAKVRRAQASPSVLLTSANAEELKKSLAVSRPSIEPTLFVVFTCVRCAHGEKVRRDRTLLQALIQKN